MNGAFKTAVPPCGFFGCFSIPIALTGVTNILSLSITAPSAGFVYVTATGVCSTITSTAGQLGYVIGTSATEGYSSPQPQFEFGSGTSVFPLVVDRVFSVSAGANTFFLNLDPIVGFSGSAACTGRMTAFFTTTTLP